MNSTAPFFNFGISDTRPPVRVRSRRAMICRPLGCSPRPVSIGEELTISDRTLRELGSDDVEFLGPVPGAVEFSI